MPNDDKVFHEAAGTAMHGAFSRMGMKTTTPSVARKKKVVPARDFHVSPVDETEGRYDAKGNFIDPESYMSRKQYTLYTMRKAAARK